MQQYEPRAEDLARLENNLRHHAPLGDQAERYAANRAALESVGRCLLGNCPPSRELSLALTHLEETCFWANAAIARNEKFE